MSENELRIRELKIKKEKAEQALSAIDKNQGPQLLNQVCSKKLETAQKDKNRLLKELGLLKGRIEREYTKAREKGLSVAGQKLARLNDKVEKLDTGLKLSGSRLKRTTEKLNACNLDLQRTMKRNKKLRSQVSSE